MAETPTPYYLQEKLTRKQLLEDDEFLSAAWIKASTSIVDDLMKESKNKEIDRVHLTTLVDRMLVDYYKKESE
jgi:hypothetical protein